MAHILQVLTELDEEATVVSVDEIGTFDLISRNAMMSGLRFTVDGDRMLPFVRAFYGQPSSSLWRTTWVKSILSHKAKEVSKETP